MQEIDAEFGSFVSIVYDIKVVDPDRLSDDEKENIYERKGKLYTLARVFVANNGDYDTEKFITETRKILCKLANNKNSISIYFIMIVAQQMLHRKSPFFWFMLYTELYDLLISIYEKVPIYYMVGYIDLIKQFTQSLSANQANLYKFMPTSEEMRKQEFRLWDVVKSLSCRTFSYHYKPIFNNLFFVKYNQNMYSSGLAIDIYIDPVEYNFSTFYNYVMLAIYGIARKEADSSNYYKQLTECVVYINKSRTDTIIFLDNHIITDISKIVWNYIPLAPIIIPYATNITNNDPVEKLRFLEL